MRVRIRYFAAVMALVAAVTSAKADFINGNFQTGNLTGWTTYTTTNGTIGTPSVVTFDTTGGGPSLAARLQVGQVTFQSGVHAGGGLLQNLNLGAGAYTL